MQLVTAGMDDTAWIGWMDAVVSFSHLLATVNSSLNFLIYCYKDEKFRQVLVRMISQNLSAAWEARRTRNLQSANNHTVTINATKGTITTSI